LHIECQLHGTVEARSDGPAGQLLVGWAVDKNLVDCPIGDIEISFSIYRQSPGLTQGMGDGETG